MAQDYKTLLRAELKDIPEEAEIMPLPRRLKTPRVLSSLRQRALAQLIRVFHTSTLSHHFNP